MSIIAMIRSGMNPDSRELRKDGKEDGFVRRMMSGRLANEAMIIHLGIIQNSILVIQSRDSPNLLSKIRALKFGYLEDLKVSNAGDIAEHHFSM